MRLIHGKTRQKLFSQNSSMELRVRLIHGCVLYTEKYGNLNIDFALFYFSIFCFAILSYVVNFVF